jgi:hypothetical protein
MGAPCLAFETWEGIPLTAPRLCLCLCLCLAFAFASAFAFAFAFLVVILSAAKNLLLAREARARSFFPKFLRKSACQPQNQPNPNKPNQINLA